MDILQERNPDPQTAWLLMLRERIDKLEDEFGKMPSKTECREIHDRLNRLRSDMNAVCDEQRFKTLRNDLEDRMRFIEQDIQCFPNKEIKIGMYAVAGMIILETCRSVLNIIKTIKK